MKPHDDARLAWLVEHSQEVTERYSGQWVAVVVFDHLLIEFSGPGQTTSFRMA